MNVTVFGLGKIGLPLSVQYSKKGFNVFGVDTNVKTVELINHATVPFPGEENLSLYLSEVISNNRLKAFSSGRDCVSNSEIVVVAVPLLVSEQGDPDFINLDEATHEISLGLKKGTLVIYETTLPIGTTRDRFARMLSEKSGLRAGFDFSLVFSPERVSSGRIFSDLKKYPKIVGGITKECAEKAKAFYEAALDFNPRPDLERENGVWVMATCEEAEFVKLAETTYRDVNIALANQFSVFANKIGVNIYEVILAANSQTFSNIHLPGIAVGGHCIPIYPQLYLWNDESATLVRNAREINLEMPTLMIQRLLLEWPSIESTNVLILGASYRSGVKEVAYSGVFPIFKELLELGATVEVFDSLYSAEELGQLGLNPLTEIRKIEIAIIQTDDELYRKLLEDKSNFPNLKVVVDGRNLFNGQFSASNVKLISV
jgi:nucleotide sugar dehydrogenase